MSAKTQNTKPAKDVRKKTKSEMAAIPGRRCRCKSAFCMVDTHEYKSLEDLMYAKLALKEPGPEAWEKFQGLMRDYEKRVNSLSDEQFAKEFPCYERGSNAMRWKRDQFVWKQCCKSKTILCIAIH